MQEMKNLNSLRCVYKPNIVTDTRLYSAKVRPCSPTEVEHPTTFPQDPQFMETHNSFSHENCPHTATANVLQMYEMYNRTTAV